MQIGDEEEILYLIAPSKSERNTWKEAFRQGEKTFSVTHRDSQVKTSCLYYYSCYQEG